MFRVAYGLDIGRYIYILKQITGNNFKDEAQHLRVCILIAFWEKITLLKKTTPSAKCGVAGSH